MKKREIFIIIIVVVAIIGIGLFIGNSITDVRKEFKEENIVMLEEKDESGTKKIGQSRSSESVIAQKIERILKYRDNEYITAQLEKIENDTEFSRNRAVVILYLAEAYQRIGDTEKAREYYHRVRTEYENGNTYFYNMTKQRVKIANKIYIISLHEESLMKEAIMDKNSAGLQALAESPKSYGNFKNILFSYGNLARENILYLTKGQHPLTSAMRFETVELGQKLVKNMLISYRLEDELDVYFPEGQVEQLPRFQEIFSTVPTENVPEIETVGVSKAGMLYKYTYSIKDTGIEVIVYNRDRRVWPAAVSRKASQ